MPIRPPRARCARVLARLAALLLATLVSLPLSAESYLNKRVVVHLKTGGRFSGVVTAEKEDGSIQVQLSRGAVWLKLDRIDKVEVLRPPEEEYAERAGKCKTADDWVELARWCGLGDINLSKRRDECLAKALELAPDHEGAHLELGHVKVSDKWYPEEEGNKLLGLEKVDGKWYPPAEAERIRRMRELKDKNKYLKGLLEQEEERRGVPWATARVIETDNYLVKCNSTKEVAERYAEVMEALYKAYNEILPESEYPRYTTEKGAIYVFRNNDEFLDFKLVPQGVGGFFSYADRAVRAYHGSFGVTGSTEMVLAHEATHQFQFRIMRDMRAVPTWLIEGMAVYYGDGTNISRNKVELHVIPRDRLQTLQEAIETNHYTPVQSLIRIPQGAFGGQFYNHAWGVIYWCLQGEKYKVHKGEGKKVWDAYLKHACSEMKGFAEVVSNYPTHIEEEAKYFENLLLKETGYSSIDAWETEYKKFILGLKLDPLGEWKSGNLWDGSNLVGIQLRFPAGNGLQRVPERELRQQFREAAAVETKDGKVRMWMTVDANYLKQTTLDPEAVKGYIRGFFKKVDFSDGTDPAAGEPKIVKVNNAIEMAVAAFRGEFAARRESSAFPMEKKEKGSGSKKDAAAPSKIPAGQILAQLAMISTPDKIYMIILAGEQAPFSKIQPQFQTVLESVKLTF